MNPEKAALNSCGVHWRESKLFCRWVGGCVTEQRREITALCMRRGGLSKVAAWPAREARGFLWQENTSSWSCGGPVRPQMSKTERLFHRCCFLLPLSFHLLPLVFPLCFHTLQVGTSLLALFPPHHNLGLYLHVVIRACLQRRVRRLICHSF